MRLISLFGDDAYSRIVDMGIRNGIEIDHKDCWEIKIRTINVKLSTLKKIDKGLSKLRLDPELSKDKKYIVEPCGKTFDDLQEVTAFLKIVQKDIGYFIIERPKCINIISLCRLPGGLFKLFLDFEGRESISYTGSGCTPLYVDENDENIPILSYGIVDHEDEFVGELVIDTRFLPDFMSGSIEYLTFDHVDKNQTTLLYVPMEIVYDETHIGGDLRGWIR